MPIINKDPIFILGCSKSGTSLLRNLLDSHPDLFVIPIETHFFQLSEMWVSYFSRRTKPKSNDINNIKENLINWVRFQNSKNNFLADGFTQGKWDIDLFSKIIKSVDVNNLNELLNLYYTALYKSLYKKDFDQKLRVVEKSVENTEFVWELSSYYPNARFIHIIRNPYANLVALRKYTSRKKSSKLKNALYSMYSSYYYLYKNKKMIQGYFTIKYEDLITDTVQVMKNISKFLDITYNDILIKPTSLGMNWQGNSTSKNKFEGISTNPLHNWKNEITKQEINIINNLFDFIFYDYRYTLLDKNSETYHNARNGNLIDYFKNIILWNSFPRFND